MRKILSVLLSVAFIQFAVDASVLQRAEAGVLHYDSAVEEILEDADDAVEDIIEDVVEDDIEDVVEDVIEDVVDNDDGRYERHRYRRHHDEDDWCDDDRYEGRHHRRHHDDDDD